MSKQTDSTRRDFIKAPTATAGAAAIAFPTVTWKAQQRQAEDRLDRLRRPRSGAINQALAAIPTSNSTPSASFQDKAEAGLERIKKYHPGKISDSVEKRMFVGIDAYQKVIDSGVDVVLLQPSGFAQHIKAAVDAGKHVFAEKPMATDAPGVHSVMKSIEKAKKQGTSIVDGFVWRWTYAQRDTYEKILGGDLGDLQAIFSSYNNNARKRYVDWNRENTKTDVEYMLRRWYYFTWLSGDHIVEQAVHSIDKMLWAKNDEVPAYAIANGGRQNRGEEEGNIYDHFGVEFAWADGTQGYHFCRQMDNCENGVWDRVYGSKGKYTGESGRKLHVFSNKDGLMWRWNAGPNGERSNNGYQTEHDEMYAAIRDGKPLNTGERMIKTTLTAMMARTAAYTGKKVTKEMMLNSKEQLVPDKLSFDMQFPPVPSDTPAATKPKAPRLGRIGLTQPVQDLVLIQGCTSALGVIYAHCVRHRIRNPYLYNRDIRFLWVMGKGIHKTPVKIHQ